MGISKVSFSPESLTSNTSITLELLPVRPDPGAYMDPPVTPDRMVGFFSPQGYIELFISSSDGRKYIRVQ